MRRFLDDHERSLKERIGALRSEIVPLEHELLEVRMAKAALHKEDISSSEPKLALASPGVLKIHDANSTAQTTTVVLTTDPFRSPYFQLTIKQLVIKALTDHFPNGGTANQMLDLFANVWGRGEILRTSLSPQLSRLKDDGRIFRIGHVWRLRLIRPDEKAATDQ